MTCPRCGAAAAGDARFCASCGEPLRPDTGSATTAASPQPDRSDDDVTRLASPAERKPSSSSGWLTSSDSISHGRFTPGTILDGRYRIIGLLGKGGMGEVYRADDLRLGQPVALKFLPPGIGRDARRLAQFHNEVRMARLVSHPNICRVFDIGEFEGQLFLSMEFVDGEDLATSLRRIGRFPEDRATEIARQICAGLASAHDRDVLHRDLKPANVMIDGAGRVRLMDFGLAASGVVEDVRAGTPAYMAPEQLAGREVTGRSDIFALGLVLYELFTGRRAYTAESLNELVKQHQAGLVTPPRSVLSTIDPAVERAILRCLDPDPARRPASALAVSAALPGGDPLAAALAAGETPSPAMVAAAGEGAGIGGRVAIPVYIASVAGIATAYALTVMASPLARLRPELTAEVLAQKAREAVRQIGYLDRPRDEAYGFEWDVEVVDYIRENDVPSPRWEQVLSNRPSPLRFWYRRSPAPMTAMEFHHDLLTPGIVTPHDPAPIVSGMIQMTLDHQGLLTFFEAIPSQVRTGDEAPAAIDWTALFTLAGLDLGELQPAAPRWNWLAASDTRVAWTGTWPGSGRPLRVEAAGLDGRPVAFMAAGPWTKPWRAAQPDADQDTVFIVVLFGLALAILLGVALLARKNVREGRGDRRGALTMAVFMTTALLVLWFCEVHLTASTGLLGMFLIAVCTSVFYGVLFWAIYLALEPFVRRHWPQTLVSWTAMLTGRVRDPVVARDVLVGVGIGVATTLLIRGTDVAAGAEDPSRFVGTVDLLGGLRSLLGSVLTIGIDALRSALLFVLILCLLRVLLRRQWAAAVSFVLLFSLLNALPSGNTWADVARAVSFFTLFAFAVLRWGLTSIFVGVFAADLLLNTPAVADLSSWYAGGVVLFLVIPVALATWALRTSLAGRPARV